MDKINEGINWEAVIKEADTVAGYLSGVTFSYELVTSRFAYQLTQVWASGNAVKFSEVLKNRQTELEHFMTNYIDLFEGYINNAINNYKNEMGLFSTEAITFRAKPVGYNTSTLGIHNYNYEFKEVVSGMTGMNKAAVRDILEMFKKDMNDFLEKFRESVSRIHISIFDLANAQREAYSCMINKIIEQLEQLANGNVAEVEAYISQEEENLLLAQHQTTATFNA